MPRSKRTNIWDEHPALLRILEDVPDAMKYPASQARGSGADATPRLRAMLVRACTEVAKPDKAESWIRRDKFALSEVSDDQAARDAWYAETPDAEYWCKFADRQRWQGKSSDRVAAGWYCQACRAWDSAVQAYIDAEE